MNNVKRKPIKKEKKNFLKIIAERCTVLEVILTISALSFIMLVCSIPGMVDAHVNSDEEYVKESMFLLKSAMDNYKFENEAYPLQLLSTTPLQSSNPPYLRGEWQQASPYTPYFANRNEYNFYHVGSEEGYSIIGVPQNPEKHKISFCMDDTGILKSGDIKDLKVQLSGGCVGGAPTRR